MIYVLKLKDPINISISICNTPPSHFLLLLIFNITVVFELTRDFIILLNICYYFFF